MTVTIYASPGLDSLRSQKYLVTAAAVSGAQTSGFVYGQSFTAQGENEVWDIGQEVQCDWITIGADEPADVRINLIDGPIFSANVYPADVGVTQTIVDGQLRLVVPSNRRLRIEVNGDRRNPLNLFVSLPQAALPVGSSAYVAQTSVAAGAALHFPPGVHLVTPGLVLGDNCTVTAQGGAVVIFTDPDVTGTAASATASSITVSGTPWVVGAYNTLEVRISGGTGVGQVRTITTSTANTLNVTPNWTTNPTAGSTFTILSARRAGFDLSTLTSANTAGVTIQGHGVFTSLAQRANAEQVLAFANQVRYCPIATDTVNTSPVNCRVIGPTFVRWPFYLQYGGAHYLRNVQWLNPWTYNSDGFQPGRKSLSDNAGLVCDSFSYCADDGVKLFWPTHRITIQNTFIVAARANCFKIGYFGNTVNDSSGASIVDCDAMNLGDADADTNGPLVYPNRGIQCIVSGFVDKPNAQANDGYYNISVTGLRVWGRMYSRLFCLQNVQYPFLGVTPQDAAGQIFDVVFDDVQTEAVPEQVSLILGRDSISTPHDLTFRDLVIGGTQVDADNFDEFVTVNQFPYNLTWDAPGLVAETGSGLSTATSYCTIAFANAYLTNYGTPAAWTAATNATKETALMAATRALDLRYGGRWVGYRYSTTQALDWPRDYAYDAAGELIASDVVPLRVQQATAVLAALHVQGVTINPTTRTTGDIKSESLSSASGSSKSVTYAGTKPAETQLVEAERMLATSGLISGSSSWGWMDL
jgi:hypothetical protein